MSFYISAHFESKTTFLLLLSIYFDNYFHTKINWFTFTCRKSRELLLESVTDHENKKTLNDVYLLQKEDKSVKLPEGEGNGKITGKEYLNVFHESFLQFNC